MKSGWYWGLVVYGKDLEVWGMIYVSQKRKCWATEMNHGCERWPPNVGAAIRIKEVKKWIYIPRPDEETEKGNEP